MAGITLKADNRALVKNAKYSYLSSNYAYNQSALVVTNSEGFSADDYILLGEIGSETTEIIKISTVTSATHTLNLASTTLFAHSESTKVTVIPYNQVKFYYTVTDTFSAATVLTTVDVKPDSYYTTYRDTTYSTGYGWFAWYNDDTTEISSNSNAIPYAGFAQNSAKKILDTFMSLLNNKEQKLISYDDAFDWLNEGYAKAIDELNLINLEYTASDEYDITIVANTAEYALPSNFSTILSVYSADDDGEIPFLNLRDVPLWNDTSVSPSSSVRYYIRGSYIGFAPTPDSAGTYTIRYTTLQSVLSSYYDTIDLPKNNYYCMKDYMMFRASLKLGKPDAPMYLQLFNDSIMSMKINSKKRDGNNDSWSQSISAIV